MRLIKHECKPFIQAQTKNYQGRSVEHMKFFAGVLYQVYLNLVSSVLKKLKTSTHKAQFCTFLYVRLEMKKKKDLSREDQPK